MGIEDVRLGGPCPHCGLPQFKRKDECPGHEGCGYEKQRRRCPYCTMSEERHDVLRKHSQKWARTAYPSYYATLLPRIRDVAREHGYAIGVHGSMSRDLDLIAVPWTNEACDGETLAQAIMEQVGGYIVGGTDPHGTKDPRVKPHGRLAWPIHLGGGPYIDLSVMPRLTN